ncbi:MAG: hypothetical protein M3305_15320 [Actinomycetota bacterium]|nr:hypothetical protein [Actinomycetota bacterium]
MSTGVKSVWTLAVTLVILGLAGGVIAVVVPSLFTDLRRPDFTLFLVV